MPGLIDLVIWMEHLMLQPGDMAPAFTHPDQDNNTVSLSDYRGQKVLLWFFPRASTPGCTAQGCSLRDQNGKLAGKNVQVVGISKDTVQRQKNFASKRSFPYPLLSDEDGTTVAAYGCWGRKNFMGREFEGILRKSFLIDETGMIERVYDKVKTKSHAEDVLADI